MAKTAQKQFEAENKIVELSDESLYKPDPAVAQQISQARPWRTDQHYFKQVRMSAVAMVKIVMHAKEGVREPQETNYEVMGILQGRIEANTLVVTDAFALPIKGSAVEVTLPQEATEYLVNYLELIKQVGKGENVIGWYHSHPGYRPFLSGIDVGTQRTNQMYQDPWLAVVVDPVKTVNAGQVDMKAFRTFPEGYTPPNVSKAEWEAIPADRIADFGAHANSYYPLEMSYYKSSADKVLLDLLWERFWVMTLTSSPLLFNRDYNDKQIRDITEKLETAESELGHGRFMGMGFPTEKRGKEESQLSKVTRDSNKATVEILQGLFGQVIKDCLFNSKPQ
eukprot:TRINITY_DN40836_c0_g1_i1.p1 TRINITY_DN40836_c0_g1~~TRINITY_DN40836_c0_g1_i1.p1  ORF type:complete len:337 (-),score=81.89 TRINITY_DN40836_c0_g1_i1:117-1127(-)